MTVRSSDKKNIGNIVTINSGSSSIKFALYQTGEMLEKNLHGSIERIGVSGTKLRFSDAVNNQKGELDIDAKDISSVSNFLIDWLEGQMDFSSVSGIGHRIVFGMEHTQPVRITQEVVRELHKRSPYDVDHMPAEIALIEIVQRRYPSIPQVACFDTSFHSTMPRIATVLPIPRRFDAVGIRRYGYHGLSYAYLVEELARVEGMTSVRHRVILAHLGSGSSMAAVLDGKSIDTSMGFTPAGGLMMGTRPGDLDPGVAWYIMQSEDLTPKQFNTLINHQSGLLGVSETSSDMRDLLELESTDGRASEAIALFCYQVKKWIGAFAAVLGGLDTLVFAGGIGENSPVIRSRICEGLGYLGIDIEGKQNASNELLISTSTSRVAVRVIHTDEEQMMARSVWNVLGLSGKEMYTAAVNDGNR